MISYDAIRNKGKVFIAITSLTLKEFEMLLPVFETAYDIYLAKEIEEQPPRERVYGGGRKPALEKAEDMLLFILFYLKLYPLQELAGFLFGMGQSQANVWIHRLAEVLKMTLAELKHLPERDPQKLEKSLTEDGESDFAIDGADRAIQRPKDDNRQKECYSGKKKRHTVKNNVIVSTEGRKVKYLSGTCEGKNMTKKSVTMRNMHFRTVSGCTKTWVIRDMNRKE